MLKKKKKIEVSRLTGPSSAEQVKFEKDLHLGILWTFLQDEKNSPYRQNWFLAKNENQVSSKFLLAPLNATGNRTVVPEL